MRTFHSSFISNNQQSTSMNMFDGLHMSALYWIISLLCRHPWVGREWQTSEGGGGTRLALRTLSKVGRLRDNSSRTISSEWLPIYCNNWLNNGLNDSFLFFSFHVNIMPAYHLPLHDLFLSLLVPWLWDPISLWYFLPPELRWLCLPIIAEPNYIKHQKKGS